MPRFQLRCFQAAWPAGTRRAVAVLLFAALTLGAHAEEPLDCVIEPHVLVDVSSSEIGVLGAVRVNEADAVRQGDVIAALRTDVEHATLELARARAETVSELTLLDRDYAFNSRKRKRFNELHNQRVVSAHDLDEVRTAADLARLRLQVAADKHHIAQLEAARDALALERRIVRSPIEGVVVQRYKTAGEYVEGDPIVQVAQLDPLRVELVAPISMFGQINAGMQATVLPELAREGDFVASVVSVDPIIDAATATFRVRLSLPNPDRRLPPGLKCTLVLHPQTERAVEVDTAPARSSAAAHSDGQTRTNPSGRDGHRQLAPGTDDPAMPIETSQAVETSTAVPGAKDPPVCATLGPIRGERQAEAIATRLTASGTTFERRYAGTAVKLAAWVVLSREIATAPGEATKRFKRAGLSDFQLLGKGVWAGRFSFGIYRGRPLAQRRADELQRLGFETELRPRTRDKTEIWLDLPGAFPGALPTGVTALLDEHPPLTLGSIPCALHASR